MLSHRSVYVACPPYLQAELRRLRTLAAHLSTEYVDEPCLRESCLSAAAGGPADDPNDVVIVGAVRTAICKVCLLDAR